MENIKFIINRSEIAAGTRGASLGPESLKVVAWKNENSLFGDYPIVEVPTANHLLNKPVKHQFAKRIEGLIEVYKNVAAEVVTAINENTFPLVLAGDHASAGGTIAGLKAAYPDKRLGVIWVDAHGDLHTPYTTPSGNMHGMPLSTALNDDNLSSKRNDVPNETVQLWEKLKAIGFEGQKVKPEDLIFVGVRDVEDEEISMMNRLNIRNFTVDEVRVNGVANIANENNQLLSQCDLIYISFDVDSMDPIETGNGTGTPVMDGLSIRDAKVLLTELTKNPKLACFEIVEINPCLDDKTNLMAETAFEILSDIINILKEKQN